MGTNGTGMQHARVWLACLALLTGGSMASCGSSHRDAVDTSAFTAPPEAVKDYVIGPLDKLSVKVFQAKDLSLDDVQVDASGEIELPLIGTVMAAGKTTNDLSKDIAERLGQKYLQSPQVSVIVVDAASQKVAVEGEVKTPGVYKMSGRTTLMAAVALAGGPSDEADLSEVAVIRAANGMRSSTIYDYSKISEGGATDPLLEGEDVVVFRSSASKIAWTDFLKTIPLFTLFSLVG